MSTAVERVQPLDNLPVDYGAVLGALGFRANDPKAQAAVLVCKRYDLDPVLKHVVLVESNVYVTRDGLLHVAHSSGVFDGLEVDEARLSDDGKEWRSRASVHRKDMSRPVTFSGRYPAGRKNSPEMAEKVAVARALRHAFDVAIATDEERQAEQTVTAAAPAARLTAQEIVGQPDTPDEPPAEDTITQSQLRKLHAMLGEQGITDRDDALRFLSQIVEHPLQSSKDLTKTEASHVLELLANTPPPEPAAAGQPLEGEAGWPEVAQPPAEQQ